LVNIRELIAARALVVAILAAVGVDNLFTEHQSRVNETAADASKENSQPSVRTNTVSAHGAGELFVRPSLADGAQLSLTRTDTDHPTSSQRPASASTTDSGDARASVHSASWGVNDIHNSTVEAPPSLPTHFRQLEEAVFEQEKSELRASIEEDTLRKTFIREAFSGGELLTADCRVTLCRVEVTFSDQDSMHRFLDEFSNAVGWNSQGAINVLPTDASGSSRIIYVLSKDGETLPAF